MSSLLGLLKSADFGPVGIHPNSWKPFETVMGEGWGNWFESQSVLYWGDNLMRLVAPSLSSRWPAEKRPSVPERHRE